jgi:carbamate kinase
MNKLAVVAFGGNALMHSGQKGLIDEQEQNVYDTCISLVPLIRDGYNIVICHGNGPQVGNIILKNIAGAKMFDIPDVPLDVSVAYTQGFMGYIIEQQLKNVLIAEGLYRDIITIVTQVLVDKNDHAFKNPVKPIGPFYTKEEADHIVKETNSIFTEDPRGRGWRKVVASPEPIKINNVKYVEKLVKDGNIVIAAGGGGIPVFYVKPQKLQGIDAVIDKDLVSAMLASQINADEFIILTDVPKVCLYYNTPKEKQLDRITIAEAKKYLEDGHFAEGSMAPKILAAIYFVENGGKKTIITEAESLGRASVGTEVIAN